MFSLNRILTILQANVNDVLDRAEDPEKMLAQVIREMEAAMAETKEQVVDAVTQLKLLQGYQSQAEDLAAEWGRRAELALVRGSEDLARECLRRKRSYEANAEAYRQSIVGQEPVVARLRHEMSLLEAKYADTVRQRDVMLARYKVARAQEKILRTASSVSIYDPSTALARMDERIRVREARAAAYGELAGSTLASLPGEEIDPEVESELLSLKARVENRLLDDGSETTTQDAG